jgi:hypothetical protein
MLTASFKSSILVGVFMIPTLFLALSVLQQKWIAWEMTEKLEHQQLHTLRIASHQLHWVKTGKEILVDGKLFDVKSFSTQGSYVQVHGLFDEEETKLVQQINRQLQNDQTGRHLQLSILYSMLLGSSHPLDPVALQPLPPPSILLTKHLLFPYTAPTLEQQCPPPQVA